MKRLAAAAALLLSATCGRADDAEESALRLADETKAPPAEAVAGPANVVSIEPAWRWVTRRPGGGTDPAQRLAIDVALQHALSPAWRLVFADRLDLNGPSRLPGDRPAVNTWKELYVSGRLGPETLVDAGRINARLGVAGGYNPTDWFRDRAVRSVTSVDPASLRENRLGTVMLRGQRLWSSGSLTALVAPRLADGPNDSGLAADVGATNDRNRWLFAWTQRLGKDFAPQLLLHGDGEPGHSPQLGLNVTRLLTDACVGHVEWAGGRRASLLAQSQGRPREDLGFRTQWAAGATCTTAHNLSLLVEFQRNGAALDEDGWRALREGPLPAYLAYRAEAQRRQDPATRENLFLHARWQDALAPRLDLSGFTRVNLADRSRLSWLEARYHWERTDLALQWQLHSGRGLSEFGALEQQRVWQVLLKHYF